MRRQRRSSLLRRLRLSRVSLAVRLLGRLRGLRLLRREAGRDGGRVQLARLRRRRRRLLRLEARRVWLLRQLGRVLRVRLGRRSGVGGLLLLLLLRRREGLVGRLLRLRLDLRRAAAVARVAADERADRVAPVGAPAERRDGRGGREAGRRRDLRRALLWRLLLLLRLLKRLRRWRHRLLLLLLRSTVRVHRRHRHALNGCGRIRVAAREVQTADLACKLLRRLLLLLLLDALVVCADGRVLPTVRVLRERLRRRARLDALGRGNATCSRASDTGPPAAVDRLDVGEKPVGRLHRHAAEVGHKVHAVGVSRHAALCGS